MPVDVITVNAQSMELIHRACVDACLSKNNWPNDILNGWNQYLSV